MAALANPVSPVVLIPAYRPDGSLPALVRELAGSAGVAGVIVVDDGSGDEYREVFHALKGIEGVHLLAHAVNLGKGAALKTGLNFAACEFPGHVGVVTADADGQHRVEDVRRVAAELTASPGRLVLGTRTFSSGVPLRSRLGNVITRGVMRSVTGQRISDTQTGLRGIPMAFIPELLRLRATGYEFELDMLVKCRNTQWRVREVPISTVYLNGNQSSHFNPLRDSMRIYFIFLRFVAVSLTAAGLDNLVFLVMMRFWPGLLLCQISGRVIAGTFQFVAGKYGVFHSNAETVVAMPKYWLTVAVSGGLSYLLIQNIVAHTSIGIAGAKLCAETILFFFSFVIQRDFVFTRGRTADE